MANHAFFKQKLGFKNRRGSHLEVAAKFVKLEITFRDTKNIYSDLKKKHLDSMTKTYKDMSTADYQGLLQRVNNRLNFMISIFRNNDALLSKQSYPQMYYSWLREIDATYVVESPKTKIIDFLDSFNSRRIQNNLEPEDQRDSRLVEYGRLSMQGTNDMASMQKRGQTLTRYLLEKFPSIAVRDTKRAFTDDERFLIWTLHGKRCSSCSKELPDLGDMDADHITAWSKGGATTLENAQCLCTECNLKKGAK